MRSAAADDGRSPASPSKLIAIAFAYVPELSPATDTPAVALPFASVTSLATLCPFKLKLIVLPESGAPFAVSVAVAVVAVLRFAGVAMTLSDVSARDSIDWVVARNRFTDVVVL